MIERVFLAILPLALVACGERDTSPAQTEEAAAGAPTGLSQQVAGARLLVDANGLHAKGAEPLRFGASREEVEAAAKAAFGSEGERSSNEECGAGPMQLTVFGPLQLAYQDGRFAGWYLREGKGVVTSEGVAPGTTTLEALKRERQVRELATTLEGEFQYTTADFGTITGFTDPDGTITGLQAGVSCFFR